MVKNPSGSSAVPEPLASLRRDSIAGSGDHLGDSADRRTSAASCDDIDVVFERFELRHYSDPVSVAAFPPRSPALDLSLAARSSLCARVWG
jgi:hypothetical protein